MESVKGVKKKNVLLWFYPNASFVFLFAQYFPPSKEKQRKKWSNQYFANFFSPKAPENLVAEQINVVTEIMDSAYVDIKNRVDTTRPVGIIGHSIGSAADPNVVHDFHIGAIVALNPYLFFCFC